MHLKPKPTVYSRIDLLLRLSKEFIKSIEEFHLKLKDFGKVPLSTNSDTEANAYFEKIAPFLKESVEKLNKDFFIARSDDEKKYANPLLEDYIRFGILLYDSKKLRFDIPHRKASFCFKNDELILSLKAPVSKDEFNGYWDIINSIQNKFIEGWDNGTFEGLEKHLVVIKKSRLQKLPVKKRKRYKELFAERKNAFNGNLDKLREFNVLNDELMDKNIFTYTPDSYDLDDSLLVFRFVDQCKSLKVATDAYLKHKLIMYLRRKHHITTPFPPYMTYYDILEDCKVLSDVDRLYMRDIIHATHDFEQKLKRIKKIYLL